MADCENDDDAGLAEAATLTDVDDIGNCKAEDGDAKEEDADGTADAPEDGTALEDTLADTGFTAPETSAILAGAVDGISKSGSDAA